MGAGCCATALTAMQRPRWKHVARIFIFSSTLLMDLTSLLEWGLSRGCGRSGPSGQGFQFRQPLLERTDLLLLIQDQFLLRGNRGVLLLQLVQQHSVQNLVLY